MNKISFDMKKKEQHKPVTILKDVDGKSVGVMVETFDERFALELHPIDNGKEYKWYDAMERLKELGKDGIDEKQGKIIAVYHKEIDLALKVAGGDKLYWEWIDCEFNGNRSWLYCPDLCALSYDFKYYSYRVRSLITLKQIEELLNR